MKSLPTVTRKVTPSKKARKVSGSTPMTHPQMVALKEQRNQEWLDAAFGRRGCGCRL